MSKKYWNQTVQKISPYVPGEQRNDESIVKLNTNENPFPVPGAVLKALQGVAQLDLRRYPQPNHEQLRQAAAQAWQLTPEEIFAGNGSDEALSLIFRSFLESGDKVTIADPTYSLYVTLAQLIPAKIVKVATDKEFQIHVKEFIGDQKMTIIANPNAPTGIALPVADLEKLARELPGLLIVDEAYVDFGAESALALIRKYDNVIVIRTFSKSCSLAGLRLGFALAHPDSIEALYRLKDSYNLNMVTQKIGTEVFHHLADFQTNTQMVIWNREFLTEELRKRGFVLTPSKANFVFARHPKMSGQELYTLLTNADILIRFFPGDRTGDWVRITVGTMQQLKALIKALDAILKKI